MKKATWIPGWYELDPPLKVGNTDDFVFWRDVPEYLQGYESLVIYNTLWKPQDAQVANGTISKIYHEDFGSIKKVDTRGLDYTITLENGKEYSVNAEEDPGKLYEKVYGDYQCSNLVIKNWVFTIEFISLSVPKPV